MWDLETIRRVNAEGLKAINPPPPLLLSNLIVKIKSTGLAGWVEKCTRAENGDLRVLVASPSPTVKHKIERTELSIDEVETVKRPNE